MLLPSFFFGSGFLLGRDISLGDQAWATTLVMVDVAAQNPKCAALSTNSDDNG